MGKMRVDIRRISRINELASTAPNDSFKCVYCRNAPKPNLPKDKKHIHFLHHLSVCQGKRVNDDIIMYNQKFIMPESQGELDKTFKVFTVIYNAARDFEVSLRLRAPRPVIDFTASEITIPNFDTYTAEIHYLNTAEMATSKSHVL